MTSLGSMAQYGKSEREYLYTAGGFSAVTSFKRKTWFDHFH